MHPFRTPANNMDTQLLFICFLAFVIHLIGTLAYSVCTISHAEADGVIKGFLARRPDFALAGAPLQTAPDTDGTDGFFVAVLHRR